MAKYIGSKVKTLIGDLIYVNINGEGVETAQTGQESRMQYKVTLECDTDGEIHKHIQAQVDTEWERYKKSFGLKGRPTKNKWGVPMTGITPKVIDDPNGTIDEDTGEIKKVECGRTLITFKTNTMFNGKPTKVMLFDSKGNDITDDFEESGQIIGIGSRGVIHGIAQGNDKGDNHKVSLYLKAVQLSKFVPYEGTPIEAGEIEGEGEIDFGTSSQLDEYEGQF